MRFRLLILAAFVTIAAGCGSTDTAPEPVTTATTPVPVSPKPIAVTVFRVDNGLLRPTVEHVPHTTAVATAALGALGLGAGVTISDGTATVALDKATQDQAAEIVYTLTQFSTVKNVDVAGRMGLTRDDFASYVPPIFVESPAAGAEVVRQLPRLGHGERIRGDARRSTGARRQGDPQAVGHRVGGRARPWHVRYDGARDAGGRDGCCVSPSAADGTPQHEVDVPVTIRR